VQAPPLPSWTSGLLDRQGFLLESLPGGPSPKEVGLGQKSMLGTGVDFREAEVDLLGGGRGDKGSESFD